MRGSRLRKSGPFAVFFSLLWTSVTLKALAFGTAAVLLVTVGSDALPGVTSTTRAENARRAAEDRARHPATAAPDQRWGTAAGQSHLADGPRNTTVPESERGRYPLLKLNQKAQTGHNVATVATPAAPKVTGYDATTSREEPDRRSQYERTYANADGTETTEFSTAPINYRTAAGDWAPIDDARLDDEARFLPAAVAATTTLPNPTPDTSDSAMYVSGGTSKSGGDELRVGTVDGADSASYIKFGSMVSRLQYHHIFGAQLSVVNYDAASCTARPVTVNPVTESWTSGGSYSYPGPSVGAALATRSFAHGYVAFGKSSSDCPATTAEMFDLGVAGRDLVQKWVDGTTANNGLSLRAAATTAAGKRFAGTGTANPPTMYVTHSAYNATYSIPKPVPTPPVLQNQDGTVQVTVTNKSAEAWTPASYYLAYRVYDDAGHAVTQQRSANLPGTVARNAKVTLTATVKALPPGVYSVQFSMVHVGGPFFTDHQVPPGQITLQVFDIPPVVQAVYPDNGYQTPTLTPLLWAQAIDPDAPPKSSLQYKIEVCDVDASNAPVNCTNSGYSAGQSWVVPSGRLSWSKTYQWRAYVKDANTEVTSPYSALIAAVPQPVITSRVAGGPYGDQGQDFDPQTGNFSTAAVDATVSSVGPSLNVVRTYNSLDPRRDNAFGAGWSTQYDMRLVADDDGSGNVVITYPDGQQVRFGKNADGTYAAPSGRTASLTTSTASTTAAWKLLDKSGTAYLFATGGKLTKITDVAGRSVTFTYNADATLAKAQVSNSQTNTAGRALTFTWSGGHVATVKADTLTWTYTYSGDLLTKACSPSACTTYDYTAGSHYRTAVLDSGPESYWRLGEDGGTASGSEVDVNLGKDAGTDHNVTLGTAGALAGTADTAASFNGTSSYVELAKGTLKKSRDAAVELWFKNTTTGTGGPLLGYQDTAAGTTATTGVPLLYVGTDGKVHGQFATGTVAPIASATTVNDGKWHHVVLSSMGTTQTLYVDGVKAGTLTATIAQTSLTYNQIGAAYATTPASWPGWGSTAQRYYNGVIDDVAVYSHPLGSAAVAAHYKYGSVQADQLAHVVLPSGKTTAAVTYDTVRDRVGTYTDHNGGTWTLGTPLVYGGDTDLRRSVQVRDPADRPDLYEYDAIADRLLRSGLPMGMQTRPEDAATPSPSPTPSPSATTCSTPDPGDPTFCTTVPGDASGPGFESFDAEGIGIRSYGYDDDGNQNKVTDENGDTVTMTFDARGNVTSRTTCRAKGDCQTSSTTYPAAPTNLYDPNNDLPLQERDGLSDLTTYTYAASGQLATQTGPDNGKVTNSYSVGAEIAYGGGIIPAGLLTKTVDPLGKTTAYAYYANGDLAQETDPTGLITQFTYDALGRPTARTQISDSYPSPGVTTTTTYDTSSRVSTVTQPATTDAVTGIRHQMATTTSYDVDGDPITVEVKDLAGVDATRTTTIEYDDYDRPVHVVDAEGGETTYEYDRFGNKTSEQDPNGNRYDYAYTARDSLAEVRLRNWRSDPEGTPATGTGDYLVLHSYSYDFAGRMVSDTDAMGRRLEYLYYGDGLLHRLTQKNVRGADGTTRDYVIEDDTYDAAGNKTKEVSENGTGTTATTYDKNGQVLTRVDDPDGLARGVSYAYDLAGNVTRTTRYGKASNVPWAVSTTPEQADYTYDAGGNVLTETLTNGSATLVTRNTYDQRGLLTTTTDPRGDVTTYKYDELGNTVGTVAPAAASESGGQAATTVSPTRTAGYDTFGEPVESRDELGNVTRQTYDRLGRAVTTTAPGYTAPGVSQTITPTVTEHYDAIGNVVESVDARGHATRYTYDQLNRMVSQDTPGSTDDQRAVWTYTYTRTGEVLSATDPSGARSESTYDDLDRQVTLTQVERAPVADTFTTRFTYDDSGNVTDVVSPGGARATNTYDTSGQLVKSVAPGGVVTAHGYDYDGREVRVSDGLGRTSRTDYDLFGRETGQSDQAADGSTLRTQTYGYDAAGNLVSSTDPARTTTTYTYDALDRLTKQVEPVTATSSITTTFGYDAAGDRTRYTDGRGNSTTYTYNTLGLPESVIEPATTAQPAAADRTWTAGYDAGGNAIRMTAPGGVVRQRTYDAAGRLTTETGSGAESTTATRTLGYDIDSRLTSAGTPGGADTYGYDDRGDLLSAAGPSGTASFRYDADGNLTTRTDAAGTTVFGYADARLHTVTDGLTGTAQTLSYDLAGNLSAIGYGAGQVRSYGYDTIGRQNGDTLRNASGQTVSSIAYAYDDNDLITSKTTTGTAGAGKQTYTHDLSGRLTSWTGGSAGTVAYGWDDSGNRVTNGSKSATYDERDRILSDGDYTYTYSARGTLASRTSSGLTEQFSFDAFDRLIAGAGQNYTYDGLDRVAARNGTAFTYAGQGDDPVSDGTETYARGSADELLAIASSGTSSSRLAVTDQHGDVVGDFAPGGAGLSDSTAYDPFGQVTASTGDTGNLGFQGSWTDPDTDQVDAGARWYNPGTGGFDSQDSTGYSGGDSVLANGYTYGAADPTDYNDPDGHWPCWSCAAKKVGGAVTSGAKAVGSGIKTGATYVYNGGKAAVGYVYRGGKAALSYAYNGLKAGYNYAKSGLKAAAGGISHGASKLWHATTSGISRSYNYGRQVVSSGTTWAKQHAAAVKQAAYERAKQVTQATRSAISYAAKHNPIKPLAAAVAPVLKGMTKLVSAAATMPAAVVSTVRNVVVDVKKTVDAVYQQAVHAAGAVVQNVSQAAQAVSGFVQDHAATIAGIAASVAVGAGCGVAIGWTGVGAVACGAAAGAVGSLVTDMVEGGHSWKSMTADAVLGGVIGGVTGGVFSGGGSAASAGVREAAAEGVEADAATAAEGGLADAVEESAASCPINSFPAGTAVLMADGSHKDISEVRAGDKVVATDPTTGRTAVRDVAGLIQRQGQKNLVDIAVDTPGGPAHLTATDGHPFWVDSQHRWVEAKDLKPGDRFETADHRPATVAGTRTWTQPARVYNLDVDTTHTFYVLAGSTGVLVHNCGDEDLIDLYHATSSKGEANIRANGVDPKYAAPDKDFGQGFYTTTDPLQADEWASKKFGSDGVTMHFRMSLSALNRLSGRSFPAEGGSGYEAMVRVGRAGKESHGFDWVQGPMLANPGQFVKGKAPAALFGQQLSLHTDAAVSLLRLVG